MADGSVVIRVAADDKDAQKALAQLRRDIERTAKSISSTEEKRNGIAEQLQTARAEAQKTAAEIQAIRDQLRNANMILSGKAGDVSFEEFNAVKQLQGEATVELREQEKLYAKQQATVTKLEQQQTAVEATLKRQTEELQQQQEQAGAVGRHIAQQSGNAMPNLRAATEAVSVSMKKGLRNILKWGLGIRSTFILIRRLRSAIVAGVKAFAEQDEETKNNINSLKASLATLKVSWGAAFAPILNAVAPILQKLIAWLTEAANTVQRLFAIIGGKSSYKKVIANNNALADSYAGAGGAAEKAEKQLMGFDQINKLDANKGGGGGGGGAGDFSAIEEAIDALDGSFLNNLALSIKDVLFDWSDLNPEQIAEKIMAGLGAALGAALGISLGMGPGGVIMLALGGLLIGLAFDALIFDHDGKLSKTELLDMLLVALNGLIGGIIGFLFTKSFKGAMIGATIATGATLAFKAIDMKTSGALTKGKVAQSLTWILAEILGLKLGKTLFAGSAIAGASGAVIGLVLATALTLAVSHIRATLEARESFYKSELGKQVSALKEDIAGALETSADLTVHINSITGEVDESTIAELSAAQALIDKIFNLDAKEGKTSTEIQLIKTYIEDLNGMGLPGVFASFDEATQHVTGTRDALMQITDELLHQYQVQAMGEAYVEALKAQYSAQEEKTKAIQNGMQAVEDYHAAEQALAQAEAEYQSARENYDLNAGYGYSQQRLDDAKTALEAAKEGVEAAKTNAEEADKAIQTAMDNIDLAAEKVSTIEETFTGLVSTTSDVGTDAAQGFIDNYNTTAEGMPTAAEQSAEDTQDALREIWQTHSPSKVTQEIAGDVTAGFVLGFEEHTQEVVSAAHSMFDAIYAEIKSSVDRIIKIMNFSWALPRPRIPVISANYDSFRYGNGQIVSIPRFFVNWYKRGGIFDQPSIIGVGESGKEAVMPLERNTGWINTLADSLLDRMADSRYADYLTGRPLPAFAAGQVVPPGTVDRETRLSDYDIDRLAKAITSAIGNLTGGESRVEQYTVDGRVLAWATRKYSSRAERSDGR